MSSSDVYQYLKGKYEGSIVAIAKSETRRVKDETERKKSKSSEPAAEIAEVRPNKVGTKLWWFNLFSSMVKHALEKFPKFNIKELPKMINELVSYFARLLISKEDVVFDKDGHEVVENFSNEMSDKDVMDLVNVLVGAIKVDPKFGKGLSCCC